MVPDTLARQRPQTNLHDNERRGDSRAKQCLMKAAVLGLMVFSSSPLVESFSLRPIPNSFVMRSPNKARGRQAMQDRVSTSSSNDIDTMDDLTSSIERAKALLAKSKEKLAAKQEGAMLNEASAKLNGKKSSSNVPFFASKASPSTTSKRQAVIKSTDEKTGLITTDGEKMASLSEQEEWECRSLFEVFENETEGMDAYSAASQQLAERDVAASIWNLRKTMQTEDYQKIFDKRNRFIGEDT